MTQNTQNMMDAAPQMDRQATSTFGQPSVIQQQSAMQHASNGQSGGGGTHTTWVRTNHWFPKGGNGATGCCENCGIDSRIVVTACNSKPKRNPDGSYSNSRQ